MTRGRYYSTVMPIWAIVYVLGLVLFRNGTWAGAGALVFALLAVIGTVAIRPCERGAAVPAVPAGPGRARDRSTRAERRAARRS